LTIRRLDLIDTITGGNKWYKLRYNLERFRSGNYSELVTFGGAYSNHIAAVARACKLAKIPCTGIIRGERAYAENTTLSRAQQDGMQLKFVSRTDYGHKNNLEYIMALFPGLRSGYFVPEGGSNEEGVRGCMEILTETDSQFSHIAVACGTGATASGLIMTLKSHQQLVGFSVLRDQHDLERTIARILHSFDFGDKKVSWHIEHDFHFGGYAKSTPELIRFTENFTARHGIPVEPVYTGKLFFGIDQLINSGFFPPGSNILAIHSGGLQYLLPG
jgi:1-aminocyclopropane-1-carboxylate deaminase